MQNWNELNWKEFKQKNRKCIELNIGRFKLGDSYFIFLSLKLTGPADRASLTSYWPDCLSVSNKRENGGGRSGLNMTSGKVYVTTNMISGKVYVTTNMISGKVYVTTNMTSGKVYGP